MESFTILSLTVLVIVLFIVFFLVFYFVDVNMGAKHDVKNSLILTVVCIGIVMVVGAFFNYIDPYKESYN